MEICSSHFFKQVLEVSELEEGASDKSVEAPNLELDMLVLLFLEWKKSYSWKLVKWKLEKSASLRECEAVLLLQGQVHLLERGARNDAWVDEGVEGFTNFDVRHFRNLHKESVYHSAPLLGHLIQSEALVLLLPSHFTESRNITALEELAQDGVKIHKVSELSVNFPLLSSVLEARLHREN